MKVEIDFAAHGVEGRGADDGGGLGGGDGHVGFGAEEAAAVFGEGVERVRAVGVGDGDVAGGPGAVAVDVEGAGGGVGGWGGIDGFHFFDYRWVGAFGYGRKHIG